MIAYPELNRIFADIEKGFNIDSCLPYAGVLSNMARIVAGHALTFFGLGLVVGAGVCLGAQIGNTKEIKAIAKAGFEYMLHGVLNIIRAVGELFINWVSGAYTFGFGNFGLILLNLDTGFESKVRYGFMDRCAQNRMSEYAYGHA